MAEENTKSGDLNTLSELLQHPREEKETDEVRIILDRRVIPGRKIQKIKKIDETS